MVFEMEMLDRFRQWHQKLLARAGYVMFNTRSKECYARDGLFTLNNDGFRENPGFKAAYGRGVEASAGFDPQIEWRIHVALWVARTASRIPGDFVECGVNAGFISSAIMQRLNWSATDKTFYLIDTFKGPVLTQYSQTEVELGRLRVAQEAVARGAYVTNLDLVRVNYSEWPNVEIVQGVVPDVLPALGIKRVAFLHLDMNCAYPERAALEHFWHLLSPYAMVLLDDYAYFGNEYLAQTIDSAATSLATEVLSLPTGQGLIIK